MLSDFQQLSAVLWVKQNDPFATNTGLIISGGQACLVDPGISPEQCTAVKQFLTAQSVTLESIILTHAHWDHLLGAAYFPGALIVAHERYRDVIQIHGNHLVKQVSLWRETEGYGSITTWVPPKPAVTYHHTLDMHIGDVLLRLIHTPGHTVDHTAVYLLQEKNLWVGDMLSDREVPLVEDINAYVRTLKALGALDAGIVVPGHGTPAITREEIHVRFLQDLAYVKTLRQCVVGALKQDYDLSQTVITCRTVPFAQPDDYPNAHRWNVESAFLALGGKFAGVVGWEQEWG